MGKILIDLGHSAVGALNETPNKGKYALAIHDSGSIDDGAYTPPAHIWLDDVGLRNLYAALHGVYNEAKLGEEVDLRC